jgi:hypothetical protein
LSPAHTIPRRTEKIGGSPESWAAQGVGEPCVIADKSKKYLYCYYTDWGMRRKRGTQIMMARCLISDAARPGTWKKWYDGDFKERGLGGRDHAVISGGFPVDVHQPQVTYVKQWDRYVMVHSVGVGHEIHGKPPRPKASGIYVSTSKDGIHWIQPIRIMTIFPNWIAGNEAAVHPTLLIKRVTEKQIFGDLVYGYTPEWTKASHYMAGRSITIKLK